MAIDRKRAVSCCEDCREIPKPPDDGFGPLTCTCGKIWARQPGVKGTKEEEAALLQQGFQRTEDDQGDVYYVLPERGHVIHLYADCTWDSDKASAGSSLEQYLAWIEGHQYHTGTNIGGRFRS